MLFAGGFYHLGEVQQLVELLRVEEIREALAPGVLELNQNLDQLYVIFELWVYYLYILFILA